MSRISTLRDAALANSSTKVVSLDVLKVLDSVSTTASRSSSELTLSSSKLNLDQRESLERPSSFKVLELSATGLQSSSKKMEVSL